MKQDRALWPLNGSVFFSLFDEHGGPARSPELAGLAKLAELLPSRSDVEEESDGYISRERFRCRVDPQLSQECPLQTNLSTKSS